MSSDDVGAVVLLRNAAGAVPMVEDLVADRIADQAPPPGAADRVAGFLRTQGFTVGDAVGPTLSLVGRPEAYERTFGVAPVPPGGDYPLDHLPADVARSIASVSAPEPLDFFA